MLIQRFESGRTYAPFEFQVNALSNPKLKNKITNIDSSMAEPFGHLFDHHSKTFSTIKNLGFGTT